ncbi:hypothetical protein Fot_38093 [Forsythia ovata]|uniref:Uncharacterized protein n=1 Tax=Forsythia ovata TaxID=205694 RepID=A0ABD1S0U5_9LAMI
MNQIPSLPFFAMKVGELCSEVMGTEDIDALRSENNAICEQFVVVEDARAPAVYDVTKSGMIQMMCAQVQKKAESQLWSMVHAKDKELTEALAKLSKAKDLLANLGVSGYADPKDPTGT